MGWTTSKSSWIFAYKPALVLRTQPEPAYSFGSTGKCTYSTCRQ